MQSDTISSNAISESPDFIEIRRIVPVHAGAGVITRIKRYAGVGFLIAVGYMDPGNWATDIEAGSRFGYNLIGVVFLSGLIAMLMQTLCVRLGVASGKDLAQLCRERFPAKVNKTLWVLAQTAIIACDFAEVLGTALAIKLLFGLPLTVGILIAGCDIFILLYLQGKNMLRIEHIVLLLVMVISVAFAAEIVFSKPDWSKVASGFLPSAETWKSPQAWYIAIGILGATVMPHNLYLHSYAVRSREVKQGLTAKTDTIRLLILDTIITLGLACFVNASILLVTASAFHFTGHSDIVEIQDAYRMLSPVLGAAMASGIFALALFASGQSSTLTGTLAGQVIMRGFLNLRIPAWKQRFYTRMMAVLPAWICIAIMGEGSVGKLLVFSQVVLSMQLPFAIIPLLLFNTDRSIVGNWAMSGMLRTVSWCTGLGIAAANLFLIASVL
ncbi:MAG TPA: Nramp family divalent metal transporter [Rickettsiales bacterium]|nr:Nramp family divalent metal transporter [Rickettsiales bacterium]